MNIQQLNSALGNIDIYLLDQLLKGRISPDMKILDAGCGEGRNLVYFINNEYDVYGVDANKSAIKMVQMQAKGYEPERFVHTSVEEMIFPPEVFDYIVSSAVLHFAKNHEHFHAMMIRMLHVLKPEGTLFIRMATDVGLSMNISEKGIATLPDGSPNRYIFRMKNLNSFLQKYNLEMIEPPKSAAVHHLRSMSVFVLRKK